MKLGQLATLLNRYVEAGYVDDDVHLWPDHDGVWDVQVPDFRPELGGVFTPTDVTPSGDGFAVLGFRWEADE